MKWTQKTIDFQILGRPDKRMLTARKYSCRYVAFKWDVNKGHIKFTRVRPRLFPTTA